MRTKNSIRNIKTALFGQIIAILITFITRLIFIRILGEEYLGIDGLFKNVVAILSLAELGFATAIMYSLYKPLSIKDEARVKSLMDFYAFIYRIIALIIMLIGLSLLPFLDFIIKDKPNIPYLNLIFILYLLNTVITYLFAYKRSLIIADQKAYITTLYKYLFFIILNIVQIIILIVTKNFILFLTAQILFTFLENVFISRKADKLYPFLRLTKGNRIDANSKKDIFKNVRAMAYHRLGGVVVNSTDNIIISSYVGIIAVGLYSNYFLVLSAINTIITQIFTSITASIGNLSVTESRNKTHNMYNSIFFINFWIIGFCAISLWILFTPFITLWIGEQYLMDDLTVGIIVLNFFVTGVRKATLIYREAMGLFWYDRYKPILESIINLIASILLAKHFGIAGVFLGTFISTMLTNFWIEPFVLYKYGFKSSVKKYFEKYAIYTFVLFIAGFLTSFVTSMFPAVTLLNFIAKVLICVIIPNIVFLLFFFKTQECKYLFTISYKVLKNKI
jgi:O-antigen/teichoic acid export membrane protein